MLLPSSLTLLLSFIIHLFFSYYLSSQFYSYLNAEQAGIRLICINKTSNTRLFYCISSYLSLALSLFREVPSIANPMPPDFPNVLAFLSLIGIKKKYAWKMKIKISWKNVFIFINKYNYLQKKRSWKIMEYFIWEIFLKCEILNHALSHILIKADHQKLEKE